MVHSTAHSSENYGSPKISPVLSDGPIFVKETSPVAVLGLVQFLGHIGLASVVIFFWIDRRLSLAML